MDKTLQKYANKKYIERLSYKLEKILIDTKDAEFLERMCYNSNRKIWRLALRNRNLAVSTMDKLLIPANYSVGSLLLSWQRSRVPISSLIKFIAKTDDKDEKRTRWQRIDSLKSALLMYYPQLTHLYPLTTDFDENMEWRGYKKMRLSNKRTHLFL